jgi:chaperonin cofactor prefoldin
MNGEDKIYEQKKEELETEIERLEWEINSLESDLARAKNQLENLIYSVRDGYQVKKERDL